MDFLYRASISSLLIKLERLGSEDLPGLWSRALIQVCTENHGGSKRLLRARCVEDVAAGYRRSGYVFSAHDCVYHSRQLGGSCSYGDDRWPLSAAAIMYQNFCLGRTIYHVLEIVAKN